jgi:hypothetical protein
MSVVRYHPAGCHCLPCQALDRELGIKPKQVAPDPDPAVVKTWGAKAPAKRPARAPTKAPAKPKSLVKPKAPVKASRWKPRPKPNTPA